MKSIVELNTTGLNRPVRITAFQFGTIPAPKGSNELLMDSVPARSTRAEIFWLKRDLKIPSGELIRYNLRFQIDLHNSAYLQICLSPLESNTDMKWRWSAPIGFNGEWSDTEQQAPWYDNHMDYCINISPSKLGINVSLSEHEGTMNEQSAFIPAEHAKSEMLRQIKK